MVHCHRCLSVDLMLFSGKKNHEISKTICFKTNAVLGKNIAHGATAGRITSLTVALCEEQLVQSVC